MNASDRVPSDLKDLSMEKIRDILRRIGDWKRAGIGGSRLRARIAGKGMEGPSIDLLIDISRTRSRSREKYPEGDRLYFTSEGLRWATPRSAADHCAGRLSSAESADISCGQGGQAISMSRTCDRVVAVERAPLNVFIASLNFRELEMDNIELIQGDCLDPEIVPRIGKDVPVFSDPARPPGSSERKLEELEPDPRAVMEVYRDRASGFCFEVPPHIRRERIDFPCEAEYVSIDGRLNRLNLYTGALMHARSSAVVLPSGYRIAGAAQTSPRPSAGPVSRQYAAEADPAVVASGLLRDALSGVEADILELDDRRTLVLSAGEIGSGCIGPPMRVLSICSENELPDELLRIGAGKVTLRFSIDPAGYWTKRKELEGPLSGKRKVHLFKGQDYIILEALSR
jgi:hypothetical protein